MKKILSIFTILLIILCVSIPTFAADEYGFEVQYSGAVVKNIEKDVDVLLIGVDGTLHSNVRIKVDISGPATPKLLATDSNGTQIDIAQVGYWGPAAGFTVQGNFTNTTPVKATFIEEGDYTITLSLIDVTNPTTVYATKTVNIEVYEDEPGEEPLNEIDMNAINNEIEELPKTGTSVIEYAIYAMSIIIFISIVGIYLNKNK